MLQISCRSGSGNLQIKGWAALDGSLLTYSLLAVDISCWIHFVTVYRGIVARVYFRTKICMRRHVSSIYCRHSYFLVIVIIPASQLAGISGISLSEDQLALARNAFSG
jgi:hypothetical protein